PSAPNGRPRGLASSHSRNLGYQVPRVLCKVLTPCGRPAPPPDHEEVHTVTVPDLPRDALILGGNRIPFARSGGAYAGISNQDLLTAALEGLVARFGLQGERLGEIAGGAVLKLA